MVCNLTLCLTRRRCSQNGTTVYYTNDPYEAVEGCDVIVTDTWVSMGVEEEKERRMKDFSGYQVDEKVRSSESRGR